jgi:hypothetical protein
VRDHVGHVAAERARTLAGLLPIDDFLLGRLIGGDGPNVQGVQLRLLHLIHARLVLVRDDEAEKREEALAAALGLLGDVVEEFPHALRLVVAALRLGTRRSGQILDRLQELAEALEWVLLGRVRPTVRLRHDGFRADFRPNCSLFFSASLR